MDVSATGPAAAAAVPQVNVEAITGSVPASTPTTANVDVTAPASTPDAVSQSASAPESGHTNNHSALAPAIAKLFAGPSVPEPIRLNVSYRIETDPNVIVTVFTDPKTGKEVAQFPPEVLVNLAQFFDQSRGATLDRSA
ncbi:MAG TPA: hypothetical protein VKR05_01685 [Candidatus Cybelea sp.]|nr:hypothetical protein [Candidatus Cybelea sp.]